MAFLTKRLVPEAEARIMLRLSHPAICEPMQNYPDVDAFLLCPTPDSWVQAALQNLDILLIDHANNEKKAAGAAFQFMFQYNDKFDLLAKMSRLAREELRHFEQVIGIIKKRGIPMANISSARYAGSLRKLVRNHNPYRLTDALVVGAIVEARSCERFAALVPHLDADLSKFYASLLKSEARHFQDYLKLAYLYGDEADVAAKVEEIRLAERELIESPDEDFRFHSGVPA
jgi:tRNA-(ms[2]io[6]A)-hydroxylase